MFGISTFRVFAHFNAIVSKIRDGSDESLQDTWL
jgi:hypothetical protein